MASKVELAGGLLLKGSLVPYLNDVRVKCEFHYYPFQMDQVTLKNRYDLPVDIEWDDPSHGEKRRMGKDEARDECLMRSARWQIVDPPIPREDYDKVGWVILRIPYSILFKCVAVRGATVILKKKHPHIISKVNDLIDRAMSAGMPCRLVWDEIYKEG
jgi:hypothetical protein